MLGMGGTERLLSGVDGLLAAYRTDDGQRYLDYRPMTSPDVLVPEDLVVTILINSRVGAAAFKAVQDHGAELHLADLPRDVALEDSTGEHRALIAAIVAQVAGWQGFAASVASKVLHKKRPALVPIMDNEAIFGAYLNPSWPTQRARTESIYGVQRIGAAVDAIHRDITRHENQATWGALHRQVPGRFRIELFDMVWWSYFRQIQPVKAGIPV